jgi:hypothetical protein
MSRSAPLNIRLYRLVAGEAAPPARVRVKLGRGLKREGHYPARLFARDLKILLPTDAG